MQPTCITISSQISSAVGRSSCLLFCSQYLIRGHRTSRTLSNHYYRQLEVCSTKPFCSAVLLDKINHWITVKYGFFSLSLVINSRTMSMVKLLYVAWFTLWKVLAVAGVFLLVLVPPPPLPPTAMMKTKPCNIKSSSIARRIIHQVGL